jgi:excisionase family DNA binding protein
MVSSPARASQTYLPDTSEAGLAEVHGFLAAHLAARGTAVEPRYLLVGAGEGDQIELPAALHEVLVQVAEAFAAGRAVTVAPQSTTLTTQEVGDLLGVSRPTVVRLVESGDLPAERVGNRRRILLTDALAYRDQRRAAQYQMLAETSVDLDEEEDGNVVRERLREIRRIASERRRSR